MKTTILILFIILGCTGAQEARVDSNSTIDLKGKWKLEELIQTGKFNFPESSMKKDGTFTLNDFLGAVAVSELPGKSIEFKEDNRVVTNWMDQSIMDKINLEYALDKKNSQIVFTAVSRKDDNQLTVSTNIVYTDSIMFWQVSEHQDVKLTRIK